MIKVDPRDFLLNTDYEMDKIVLVKEGNLAGPQTISIAHGLPFWPLLFGFCSFNADFTDSKPLPFSQELQFTGSPTPSISARISVSVHTDKTNIVLTYANNHSSPQPIYYKIYAFEPTDSNKIVGATKGEAKVFLLDTDRDYRKIYKKGTVDAGGEIVLDHKFGYIPQIMAWYELSGQNAGYITNDFTFTDTGPNNIVATDQRVTIDFPITSPLLQDAKLHYRIYYDEA